MVCEVLGEQSAVHRDDTRWLPLRRRVTVAAARVLFPLHGLPWESSAPWWERVALGGVRLLGLAFVNLYVVYRAYRTADPTYDIFPLINAGVSACIADSVLLHAPLFRPFVEGVRRALPDPHLPPGQVARLASFYALFAAYQGTYAGIFPFSATHWFDVSANATAPDFLHAPSIRPFTHLLIFSVCVGTVVSHLMLFCLVCCFLQEALTRTSDELQARLLDSGHQSRVQPLQQSPRNLHLEKHQTYTDQQSRENKESIQSRTCWGQQSKKNTETVHSRACLGQQSKVNQETIESMLEKQSPGNLLSVQCHAIPDHQSRVNLELVLPRICADHQSRVNLKSVQSGKCVKHPAKSNEETIKSRIYADQQSEMFPVQFRTSVRHQSKLNTQNQSRMHAGQQSQVSRICVGHTSEVYVESFRSRADRPSPVNAGSLSGVSVGDREEEAVLAAVQEAQSRFVAVADLVQKADDLFSLFGFVGLGSVFARACSCIHFYLNMKPPMADSWYFLILQVAFDLSALTAVSCFAAGVPEAGRRLPAVLFGASARHPPRRVRVHAASLALSKVALSAPLHLTAWRLFPFTRRVLPAVIGVTLSYSAVIVQMHHAASPLNYLTNATRT